MKLSIPFFLPRPWEGPREGPRELEGPASDGSKEEPGFLRAGLTPSALRASMSANLQESVHSPLVRLVDKMVFFCQDVYACHFLDHVKDVGSIVTALLGRDGGDNDLLPQKVKHAKLRGIGRHLG